MKAILIILFLLFSVNSSTAQGVPVYDNTNFLSLVKSLVESAKQTSQLLKTVEFLRDQKEKIERVNSVIKQLKAVKEITQNNHILISTVRRDLREILNSPHIRPEEVVLISESFNSIIELSLEDLNFMQQVLSSSFLNMTDAQRIEILEAQRLRSRIMVAEINQKYRRYQNVISFREIQEQIINRILKP